MSIIVNLELSVIDHYGNNLVKYYKQIEMQSAPNKDTFFAEEDTALQPKDITYAIDQGQYYVRFSEYIKKGSDESFDYMEEYGWVKRDA